MRRFKSSRIVFDDFPSTDNNRNGAINREKEREREKRKHNLQYKMF